MNNNNNNTNDSNSHANNTRQSSIINASKAAHVPASDLVKRFPVSRCRRGERVYRGDRCFAPPRGDNGSQDMDI